MVMQGLETAPVVGSAYTLAGNHHQIEAGQPALMMSETFPYQAFDPVSLHRAATVFLGNRQPKPGIGHAIRVGQHQKEGIRGTPTIVKNPTVFVGFY